MLKFSIIVLSLIFIIECDKTEKIDYLQNTNNNKSLSSAADNESENLNQKINEAHEVQDKSSITHLEETTKTSHIHDASDRDNNISFMYLLTPVSLLIIGLIIFRTMRYTYLTL